MDSDLIMDQKITDTLEQNYMPYAMSVIVSRAIPEIDGFKPSHRKILYTMYKMKLLKGQRTKSANVVGQTMKLNPHGDQAIYATLVRLAHANESLLLPYIDSKGNFGKVTSRDMKYAAPRYTEVKLAEICEEIFMEIDKENVEFVDNYDGSMKEPSLLPITFPNILANPNKGIAVGMASNFASFNLKELCHTTIAFIKNPEVDLLSLMPAPDFPTGGELVYVPEEMQKIYETGQGSFKIRGKAEYVKEHNMIEISEIPYTTTIEQIIDKIIELVKVNKIKEINDVRDETDLKGLKIAIDLKRGSEPDKLIAKLFKYTPLEDSFSCNFNLLINGRPKVLGVKSILHEWLIFRRECIRQSVRFDIRKLSDKLHLLYGLKEVLLDIDLTIKIIRETERDKEVVGNLMNAFGVDDIQAEYVADIKLRYLNKEYILNRLSELTDLEKQLDKLKDLLESESKINKVIIKDLERVVKKYGQDRKTQLVMPNDIAVHNAENHVEDYNLKVFFTAHNYFKKVSLVSLRSSGDHKIKEEDEILQEIEGNNKDEILFFTNQNNVYKLKLYEIEDQKVSSLGVYLPNILDLEKGEEVVYCVITREFEGFMIFGFENGKIARVPLEAYKTKTNRKKLVKAYSDESRLVGIFYFNEEGDFLAIREDPKGEMRALLCCTELVTEKVTKNTKGIQIIRMKKGTQISAYLMPNDAEIVEVEKYRITSVPKSGDELDLASKLAINQWLDKKNDNL
ncbi:DNA topoisomerase (ATP-hydrolyzing) subunit A [Fusibacter sp. 3D3]|uniref:DNA gyrase/topoisomerase IV subunit A n=1 Tax=Fusibacter sp. 3D3 TaxID=1048380 RepID=UPI000853EF61|nr:DNA topoisomerase (ATP-hydrolyzing) subunit A [Fusibacter sp. 3D3]GAU79416.1 topoisomerase IV subunit A [Fusibacter sp. 3D3]